MVLIDALIRLHGNRLNRSYTNPRQLDLSSIVDLY